MESEGPSRWTRPCLYAFSSVASSAASVTWREGQVENTDAGGTVIHPRRFRCFKPANFKRSKLQQHSCCVEQLCYLTNAAAVIGVVHKASGPKARSGNKAVLRTVGVAGASASLDPCFSPCTCRVDLDIIWMILLNS